MKDPDKDDKDWAGQGFSKPGPQEEHQDDPGDDEWVWK